MVDVTTLIEIAIDGIGLGMLFALLGAGITLIFGMGEILNLAQGVFAVLTALVVLEAVNAGVPLPAAVALSLVAIAAFGLAIDRALLGSVYRSTGEERIIVGIFVTLGITVAIEALLFMRYPYRFALQVDLPTVRALGLVVRGSSLLNVAVGAVVLGALFGFLQRTYLGYATRTITQDEVGARVCGVDTRRIRTVIFVLAAVLAGVAGLLQGMGTSLAASSGFALTVQALIVSIVGGVRDVRGTVAAGLGLGLVVAYANFFVGTYLSTIAMLAAAMLALVARREELA